MYNNISILLYYIFHDSTIGILASGDPGGSIGYTYRPASVGAEIHLRKRRGARSGFHSRPLRLYERIAGAMGEWPNGPMDAQTDPRSTGMDGEGARGGRLLPYPILNRSRIFPWPVERVAKSGTGAVLELPRREGYSRAHILGCVRYAEMRPQRF